MLARLIDWLVWLLVVVGGLLDWCVYGLCWLVVGWLVDCVLLFCVWCVVFGWLVWCLFDRSLLVFGL